MLQLLLLTSSSSDPGWLKDALSAGSLILTLVGIVGVILAYWTLRTIKRQADLMDQSNRTAKKTAETALAQTQAMVAKERARLFVDVRSEQGVTVDLKAQNGIIGGSWFRIINVGPTPAINMSVRYSAVATEFESATVSKTNNEATAPEVIAANSAENIHLIFQSAFSSSPPPQGFCIHVFGVIEYDDVVSPDRRTRRFRFRIRMTQRRGDGTAVQIDQWQRCGPPEDNSGD